MIKAVIFDMDGVIVDSEPLHKAVERQMFVELGMDVTPARQHAFTGTSNAIMWTQLKAEYHLPESVETYVTMKEERFLRLLRIDTTITLIPGVEAVLHSLFERAIPVGLASSSSVENIKIVLERFNLNRYFRAVASGEEVPLSKPNPDVFLLAAKRIGVKATDCLVIEDSANGAKAAKAAGMFCVGLKVDEQNHQDLALADRVITSFSEFQRLPELEFLFNSSKKVL
jgi:beta-phosphoglucomutase family hydrolase